MLYLMWAKRSPTNKSVSYSDRTLGTFSRNAAHVILCSCTWKRVRYPLTVLQYTQCTLNILVTKRVDFLFLLPSQHHRFSWGGLPRQWLFNGIAIMISAIFFQTRANQGTQARLCCGVYMFPGRL